MYLLYVIWFSWSWYISFFRKKYENVLFLLPRFNFTEKWFAYLVSSSFSSNLLYNFLVFYQNALLVTFKETLSHSHRTKKFYSSVQSKRWRILLKSFCWDTKIWSEHFQFRNPILFPFTLNHVQSSVKNPLLKRPFIKQKVC